MLQAELIEGYIVALAKFELKCSVVHCSDLLQSYWHAAMLLQTQYTSVTCTYKCAHNMPIKSAVVEVNKNSKVNFFYC